MPLRAAWAFSLAGLSQPPGNCAALGSPGRQRMDFLLLAANRSRIVIEVDGVQHYGRENPPNEQGHGSGQQVCAASLNTG